MSACWAAVVVSRFHPRWYHCYLEYHQLQGAFARSRSLHTRSVCDDIGDGGYDCLALPPKFADIR